MRQIPIFIFVLALQSAVAQTIPDFQLKNTDGEYVSFEDIKARNLTLIDDGNQIVYFHEGFLPGDESDITSVIDNLLEDRNRDI